MFQTSEGMVFTGEEHLEAVLQQTPDFETFSARIKMTLPTKKSSTTVNGTLKMQRNELIQISLLMPLIRTEIVRIDITPEYLLLIDRMKKRYAKVPVSQLKEMFQVDLDFFMLQALFSNELFLQNRAGVKAKDFASFKTETYGNEEMDLSIVLSRRFLCTFRTGMLQHNLLSTTIAERSTRKQLQWDYSGFTPLKAGMFPSEMKITMGNAKVSLQTALELSRMQTDNLNISTTEVPYRYDEITLSELLKMLD